MPVEQGQSLSERELEITTLVAEGLTNREIALRLFLSPNTVKVHLRNIFTKTGVASRTELSMLAVQERWIELLSAESESKNTLVDVAQVDAAQGKDDVPRWSWQRWAIVSVGVLVILSVILLPSLPTRQAVTSGPGFIFGPSQEIPVLPKSDAEGRWNERAPLPVRRAGMGVAIVDGKAYIIGGINSEGATGRVDIYDIHSDQWTLGEPLPVNVGNVSAVALGEQLYVPGGCNADWVPLNELHKYNPQTDTWSNAARLPVPLCAYALTTFQERMYLFGGWNGDAYTPSGYMYDPADDTWHTLTPPASVRGFGGAAVLADRIFYIGGFDGRRELDICEVYDPTDNDWQLCSPMLQPRGGIGIAATTGRLYVLGGGWDSFLGFNEQFSPESGQWTVMDTPIVGEWRNVGAFVWERSLYVVGGWSGSDFLNQTYAVEIMPWKVFMPGTFRTP